MSDRRRKLALREIAVAWAALLTLLAGCGSNSPPGDADSSPAVPTAAPRPQVKLQVFVVGDPELEQALTLQRGEWAARGGGEFSVSPLATDRLEQGDVPPADVLIFPSRFLGVLAERELIQPLRASLVNNPEFAATNVFGGPRAETSFGGKSWAVSLGTMPLLMRYTDPTSPDAGFEEKPRPGTWREHAAWVKLHAAAVPREGLAPAWELLVRALSLTESQRRSTLLFDPDTMAPRLTDPPFVRALEELLAELHAAATEGQEAAASGASPSEGPKDQRSPGSAATAVEPPKATVDKSTAYGPIPLAEEFYSTARQSWQPVRGDGPIAVVAVEGRLIAVSRGCRNAVAAFELCRWLAAGERGTQLSARAAGTAPYRRTPAQDASHWSSFADFPKSAPEIQAAVESESPFLAPRIAGMDEYLGTLAEGVRRAADGDAAPAAILAEVAQQWETTTTRLGRAKQLRAYRRHLGLDESE
jgi:multiple sugar transport system substrate-binding protein